MQRIPIFDERKLGVGLGKAEQLLLPEQKRLLEAFTNILALALDRRGEFVNHGDTI